MKIQASLDALFTSASLMAVFIILVSSFAGLYKTAEKGIRGSHLEYLSRVIEDRMKACSVVDGVKIYSPYEVNVLCEENLLCWNDLCKKVRCSGGGKGRVFVVKECTLLPVE